MTTTQTHNDTYILTHFKGQHWRDLAIEGIAPYRVWRIDGVRQRRVRGWQGWQRKEHSLPPVPQTIYFVAKDSSLDPIQKFVRLKDAKAFAQLLAEGDADVS